MMIVGQGRAGKWFPDDDDDVVPRGDSGCSTADQQSNQANGHGPAILMTIPVVDLCLCVDNWPILSTKELLQLRARRASSPGAINSLQATSRVYLHITFFSV